MQISTSVQQTMVVVELVQSAKTLWAALFVPRFVLKDSLVTEKAV